MKYPGTKVQPKRETEAKAPSKVAQQRSMVAMAKFMNAKVKPVRSK